MQSDAPMKIELSELGKYSKAVSELLKSVTLTRTERSTRAGYAPSSSLREFEETVTIITEAQNYGETNCILLPDMVNHTLHTVQRGFELGLCVSELYKKASGLDLLVDRNKREGGFKIESERVEFNKKNETCARIVRFVASHYIVWELTGYNADVVDSVKLPPLEQPETDDRNSTIASKTAVFHYGDMLVRLPEKTPESFVKLTKVYFEQMLEVVKSSTGALSYTEPFEDRAYKLEDSDFVVHGFSTESRGTTSTAEFSKLSFSDIVGNREAKHEARRLVFKTCCYDAKTERNPFSELTGRFQSVRLGHGVPGTGKTMQIAATATLFSEICEMVGMKFTYNPLEPTVVSTFQGGSAERMQAWFSRFHDSKQIIYSPIDDAEQLLQDRTMQGVSAGVREVISLFLTGTEGAGATYMKRGNAIIETFTNLPEQIDPAVMSRHQSRFPIEGARRWEDFLDQDHLWWRQFADVTPEFVADMQDPTDYKYMQIQATMRSLSDSLEHYTEPKNPTMNTIFKRVIAEHDVKEYRFFAALATEVQKEFPKFSSRETRNIQSAISARMVDFDAPAEWMEDPDKFFRQEYDQKLILLKDLMRESMGGLKMQDVWVQEACRYLDTFAVIEEQQFRRDVARRVADMKVIRAAEQELMNR